MDTHIVLKITRSLYFLHRTMTHGILCTQSVKMIQSKHSTTSEGLFNINQYYVAILRVTLKKFAKSMFERQLFLKENFGHMPVLTLFLTLRILMGKDISNLSSRYSLTNFRKSFQLNLLICAIIYKMWEQNLPLKCVRFFTR